MKMRAVGTALLVAMLAVAGCGGSGSDTKNSSAPAQINSAAKPAPGGTEYKIVAAESTASYSVQETFLQQNLPAVAVGKTSAITGSLFVDGGKLQPSMITVDLRTLKSDRGKRDEVIQTRGLESAKYPMAEFTISSMDQVLAEGKEAAFKLTGKLKVHGVEKNVTWDAKGTLTGGTVKLAAQTKFKMGDFQIEPPNVANVLAVRDDVQLDVNITAKK